MIIAGIFYLSKYEFKKNTENVPKICSNVYLCLHICIHTCTLQKIHMQGRLVPSDRLHALSWLGCIWTIDQDCETIHAVLVPCPNFLSFYSPNSSKHIL